MNAWLRTTGQLTPLLCVKFENNGRHMFISPNFVFDNKLPAMW